MIDKRQLAPAKPFFVQGKQVSEEFKTGDAERGWLFLWGFFFFFPLILQSLVCASLFVPSKSGLALFTKNAYLHDD